MPPIETIEMTKRITVEAIERFEADMGCKPTASHLEKLLGGDRRQWGRILKGSMAKGSSLAKLKILREHGSNANYVLACARKSNRYGHKNRKNNLVIHATNILNDLDSFQENKILEDRMQGIYFDDPYDASNYYFEELSRLSSEGPHYTETLEEELKLQRDFYKSL